MRYGLGVGYLHASATYLGQTETISGAGLGMNAAFGAAVAHNLVLFGQLSVTSVEDPTVKSGGVTQSMTATSVGLIGFAPGVAYYLEPLNLYLSGSLGLSMVSYNDNTSSSSDNNHDLTDWGFAASFIAGKEWWVSSNWGLGAATMLNFGSMKMRDYDTRMTATAISLLFSATFN